MSHNVIHVQRFILRDIVFFRSGGEIPVENLSFTQPHIILYDFHRKGDILKMLSHPLFLDKRKQSW